MKQIYLGVVDKTVPGMCEEERVRLLNKLQPEYDTTYAITFTKEPLDKYPYVMEQVIDLFRREDGTYSFKGDLMSLETLLITLKDRLYVLALTCTIVDGALAGYKVLEVSQESEQ